MCSSKTSSACSMAAGTHECVGPKSSIHELRARPQWLGVLLAAGVLCVHLSGCFSDPEPSENLPPQINGFLVNGERREATTLREGESVAITVIAWDPNGDPFGSEFITWEATDGTIEGSGSSVRLRAPGGIQWENPPQEVNLDVSVTVTDGVNDPATRSLLVRVLPPCPADNLPPVILGVHSDPEGIPLGGSASIWVEAQDPEGQEMTYTWTPPFGTIEGSGREVRWVADQVCCTDWYDIEVVVSDGCKSSWSFVSVHVDV